MNGAEVMNRVSKELAMLKPLIEEWGQKNVEEALIYISHQYDRKGLRVSIKPTPEMVRDCIEAVHGRLGVNEYRLTVEDLKGPWFDRLTPDEQDYVLKETQEFTDGALAMAKIMSITKGLFPGEQKRTEKKGTAYHFEGAPGKCVGLYTVMLKRLKDRGAQYLLWNQYPTFNFPGLDFAFIAFDKNEQEVRLD
jgi:hypothetical protein